MTCSDTQNHDDLRMGESRRKSSTTGNQRYPNISSLLTCHHRVRLRLTARGDDEDEPRVEILDSLRPLIGEIITGFESDHLTNGIC